MNVQFFCRQTIDAAKRAASTYGVNAIGLMAQAAIETGWGDHTPGNMWFGIKATNSWKGKKQLLWTTEYIDGEKTRVRRWFRAYDTADASFADYAQLISRRPRYAAAMQYPDYEQTEAYVQAVAAAGYATDPNYAAKLRDCCRSIKRYVSATDLQPKKKIKKSKLVTTLAAASLLAAVFFKHKN